MSYAPPRRLIFVPPVALWLCRVTIYAIVCLLLAACGQPAPAPSAPPITGELLVSAPQQIQAGSVLQVRVERADAAEGLALKLVVEGSYGVQVYDGTFANSVAVVLIPGEDTHRAGMLTLIATAGAARGEGHVAIMPGPAVDPVTPLVGGRSIIADGEHWSIAVAVPFDSYGNPLADTTPVEFRTLHPGERLETRVVPISGLLAWQRIFSSKRAGRALVSVRVEDAYGPEATFAETPGWPTRFGLSASPTSLPADGRRLLTLRTDVIRDAFGNPMLDGTLVTFVVETPEGAPRLIPAYTIDGAAEAQLQAAAQPGSVTVRATLYGVESDPLSITFTPGPAVGVFPTAAYVNGRDGIVALEVGPLLGPLGQFVPEGVPVHFVVTGPDHVVRTADGVAAQGYARAELRLADLPSGPYTVEAQLGTGRGQTTFVAP